MSIIIHIILLEIKLKGLKMDVKAALSQYGIKSVYHFTDKANLPTIQRYGIQSLKNIFNLNIPVQHFGAEELSHMLDERRGLDKYVHLSFVQDHPMYHVAKARGNIIDPIWIELDISVLLEQKTLFCDKVANKTNSHLFDVNGVMKFIDFDSLVYSKDFNTKKEARKAEILVHDFIGADKIKGIHYGK